MKNWKPDSVVVMPTLVRPEFLALSLEKLSRTPEIESVDVRIFLDVAPEGRLEEIEYVRDTYLPTAEIFQAGPHPVVPSGAWNILNSLKAGYETGANFIFLVEEDIMVYPNFFQKHREMQASGDYFVTSGRRVGHMPVDFFSNPGSCYRREKLAHVVPHINADYFANPTVYLNRHFPNMDTAGVLDDGMIRRIMRGMREKAICADPPCAVHQGFHYYDKLEPWLNRTGSIQERIARLRNIIAGMDPMARYSKDFEPFKEE